MPGDNEYGTWGSRRDEQRQWKLCNGQWVRVAEPKPKPAPKYEKYLAERVKCKPPKKIRVARAEPVEKIEPQSGSKDNDSDLDSLLDSDLDEPAAAADFSPLDVDLDRSPPIRSNAAPILDRSYRPRRQPPVDRQPVDDDIDALKDKYRPKKADKPLDKAQTNSAPDKQPGTILLKPPTPPVEEIKVEPIQPTYVEMKRPLSK